jgi:hypothetical protein
VNNSYATGNVEATEARVAALVGSINGGTVNASYSTGNVTAYGGCGGIGGRVWEDFSVIEACYATGAIFNSTWPGAGQLLGSMFYGTRANNSICYNRSDDDAVYCVGNNASHHLNDDYTTSESYFYNYRNEPMTHWDFTSVWSSVCDGKYFPTLQWEGYSMCPFDFVTPNIFFTDAPVDSSTQSGTHVITNTTIGNASDLDSFTYNWNGENFTLFNDSLVLLMNFENLSSLGENNTVVADISSSSNDGSFGGNA